MNPNDLADISSISSDTVIRRSIVSNDGHRILVVGTIPERTVPYVSVKMDSTEIIGGTEVMTTLRDTIRDVLEEMDEAMTEAPIPCERCGGQPAFVVSTDGGMRYRVQCTRCGLRTGKHAMKADAACAWHEGDYENDSNDSGVMI